ncbi:retrotransposon protein, putative, ty1-copia subclass [Tanacetum coccineum]
MFTTMRSRRTTSRQEDPKMEYKLSRLEDKDVIFSIGSALDSGWGTRDTWLARDSDSYQSSCKEFDRTLEEELSSVLSRVAKEEKNATSGAGGGSCIFVIELNTFLNRSWIYDTGCGTHICNTTQGLRASRKLKPGALSLYVGNGQREAVEAIGNFDLSLPSGLVIVLNNCHYAPSITRGVISVSRFAIPRDGIFEIDLSNSYANESSIYTVSNKRAKLDLDSALLWHCRLGHISKKRIEKLQHDGLLNSTDLRAFEKCVPCMSGKMARENLYTHQVERAKDLLGLIHTDVCGPFKITSRQGANYFVTFTDDFSRYVKSIMSQSFWDHLRIMGGHYRPSLLLLTLHISIGVSEEEKQKPYRIGSIFDEFNTTLPKSFSGIMLLRLLHAILQYSYNLKVEMTTIEVWHGQDPLSLDDLEMDEPQVIIIPFVGPQGQLSYDRLMCLYIDAEDTWCGGGDVGGGGVIATAVSRGDGGDGGEVRRVTGSELVDRGDPEMELVFGVGRKIPPEKISGGGAGRLVVAGGAWSRRLHYAYPHSLSQMMDDMTMHVL